MEWLLTVLIATTFNTTPIPVITTEHLSGISSLQRCVTTGLYTRSVLLQPDFRLPGETMLLVGEPVSREVLIFCHQVQPA